ncbi:hypothetical protein [Chitinophaga flava]|nr:hypothetical protein [Chitinophaga flava]
MGKQLLTTALVMISLLMWSASAAVAQKQKNADATIPRQLAPFIPKGYLILDTTSGDLNLDPYPDMIMVLYKPGEDSTSDVVEHPEKRPLLILLGQPDHSYKLAARNDNVVYCVDCGGIMGDPFESVVIKNGYFSVEHYGGSAWRWTRIITFKYSPTDKYWYLHKDGGDSFHASEPDKVTSKVRTSKDFGKVPFNKFDIYKKD